jgi:L-ribulose-5-phosphate 3-epimerase
MQVTGKATLKTLAPWEIGVMFWAGRDPAETLGELKRLGILCGQLGIPGDLDISSAAVMWRKALDAESFTAYTAVAAYNGESYADVPTVRRTVGFIPPGTRAEREKRTYEVSDFAAALGVPGVATHIGFIPEDDTDPDYIAVREMVRRVCDHCAANGQTFALETGQEAAEALRSFLLDVNRDNLGINFDPANMILYGTGDPIEALGTLGAHVLSVHCKDGDWPPKGQPDALGHERPLGKGAVGVENFLRQLKAVGYHGPLAIEREVENPAERLADIESGISLLRRLTTKSA